jgi:hypothetical protein
MNTSTSTITVQKCQKHCNGKSYHVLDYSSLKMAIQVAETGHSVIKLHRNTIAYLFVILLYSIDICLKYGTI